MTLKEILKEKRTEKGYSQERLAQILGYSSGQFVSNWERGESYPPIDRLAKLSLLFDFEDGTLLKLFLAETRKSYENDFAKALAFHKSFESKS